MFKNADEGAALFKGEEEGYVYTRIGNPTVKVLEAKMNALEGAQWKLDNPEGRVSSIAFSSGMAAISATMMACAQAGETLLVSKVVYGATENLTSKVLSRFGVHIVEVNMSDLDVVKAACEANPQAKAIYFETPMNPTMELADIQAISDIAHAVNPDMHVIVDSTFATPYLQRPLELGADVVVHSTTKYIGGHGVIVGGMLTTTSDEVKAEAYKLVKDIGSNPSPFDAWLTNTGLKTLPARMEQHCRNAMAVARYLDEHPAVEVVHYPGLESHPQHAIAKKQMSNFGGMLSFELKGGVPAGKILMDNIEVFTLAVSLGAVDSLIQHPASMTHGAVPRDKRLDAGITDGLVRISVGIENTQDLINALDKALKLV